MAQEEGGGDGGGGLAARKTRARVLDVDCMFAIVRAINGWNATFFEEARPGERERQATAAEGGGGGGQGMEGGGSAPGTRGKNGF
jgi:hypothetical protein